MSWKSLQASGKLIDGWIDIIAQSQTFHESGSVHRQDEIIAQQPSSSSISIDEHNIYPANIGCFVCQWNAILTRKRCLLTSDKKVVDEM